MDLTILHCLIYFSASAMPCDTCERESNGNAPEKAVCGEEHRCSVAQKPHHGGSHSKGCREPGPRGPLHGRLRVLEGCPRIARVPHDLKPAMQVLTTEKREDKSQGTGRRRNVSREVLHSAETHRRQWVFVLSVFFRDNFSRCFAAARLSKRSIKYFMESELAVTVELVTLGSRFNPRRSRFAPPSWCAV